MWIFSALGPLLSTAEPAAAQLQRQRSLRKEAGLGAQGPATRLLRVHRSTAPSRARTQHSAILTQGQMHLIITLHFKRLSQLWMYRCCIITYCGFYTNLGYAVRAGHKLSLCCSRGYFVLGPGAPGHGVLNPGAGGWGYAKDGHQPQAPALLLSKGGNPDSCSTARVRLTPQQPTGWWFEKLFRDLEIQLQFPVLLDSEFASSICQACTQSSGGSEW